MEKIPKRFLIKLITCDAFELINLRTYEPLNYWAFGLVGLLTNEPSGHWTVTLKINKRPTGLDGYLSTIFLRFTGSIIFEF